MTDQPPSSEIMKISEKIGGNNQIGNQPPQKEYQGYVQHTPNQAGYNQPGLNQPVYYQQVPYQQGYYQPMVMNQIQPQVITVIRNPNFGTSPVPMVCQFCRNAITTKVMTSCSIGSVCLCLCTNVLIWLCVQLMRDKEVNCLDAEHRCPICGQVLGIYNSC